MQQETRKLTQRCSLYRISIIRPLHLHLLYINHSKDQGACGKIHCGLSARVLFRFSVILCSRVSIADITDCVIMYCSPYFCLFLFFSRFNPHSLVFTPAVQVLHFLSTNLHFLPIPAFHPEVIRPNRSLSLAQKSHLFQKGYPVHACLL